MFKYFLKKKKSIVLIIGCILVAAISSIYSVNQFISTKVIKPYCADEESLKKVKLSEATEAQITMIEKCLPITIDLDSKISNDQITVFKNELTKQNGVSKISYTSKDQSFATFEQLNKDNPTLLQLVHKDAFFASFIVNVTDPSFKSAIVKFARSKSYIKRVDNPQYNLLNLIKNPQLFKLL